MKASKTWNQFQPGFQQPKTSLPIYPVLTSLIETTIFRPVFWIIFMTGNPSNDWQEDGRCVCDVQRGTEQREEGTDSEDSDSLCLASTICRNSRWCQDAEEGTWAFDDGLCSLTSLFYTTLLHTMLRDALQFALDMLTAFVMPCMKRYPMVKMELLAQWHRGHV